MCHFETQDPDPDPKLLGNAGPGYGSGSICKEYGSTSMIPRTKLE
jgi:hypothetical protein